MTFQVTPLTCFLDDNMTILSPVCNVFFLHFEANIYDDMLSGFGWTMQDYARHSRNECCLRLPNGHKLLVHDLRRVAVRAAIAMAEEGDVVVNSFASLFCIFIRNLRFFYGVWGIQSKIDTALG